MAVDYFLKIAGIPGESNDAKHKNEIEVQSFSWSEQAISASSTGSGGAGSGKVVPGDFRFTAHVSKASPLLMLACAMGTHVKDATLVARKSGSTPIEFLTLVFSDVRVSSYAIAGAHEDESGPLDSVSLSFATLRMTYRLQKPDGSVGQSIVGAFDFQALKKI